MDKAYRVFDYTWHIAHQYDLIHALRDDCSFDHCMNAKRHWDTSIRPRPANLRYVTHYKPGAYDVAILHIDQEIVVPGHLKRRIFDEFSELVTDIPRIVINHGTPVCPELYRMMGAGNWSEQQMEEHCRRFVKTLVGNDTMVVNSYDAASAREWGFGVPIVHGMNPNDWRDLPKEPRAFTAIGAHGFETSYNRACMVAAAEILDKEYGYPLAFAKVNIDTGSSPENYRNYLGSSLLYIDTSYRTPMNRSRTEAFLSGCCVIQVEGAHDLKRWAEPGENIVLVPDDPGAIAATIARFIRSNYQEALRIGQNGKMMARREFSVEHYRADWLDLLKQVTGR
jgi:glycosyltransferase involved in cell wall biosynthesis